MSEIERLKWRIDDLRTENRRLERENQELQQKLGEAEYRIRGELEPRIHAEKRGYDHWATSPER